MVDFLHVDANDLLVDAFRLGRKVYEDGFRPKHVISIWRGGTPIGLAVDAYFRFQGVYTHHTSMATTSYVGIGEQADVVVKGLEHLVRSVCREDGLLIIDDVYESGRTIRKIVETLRRGARRNAPRDIRVAVVHRKDRPNQYDELPVYHLHDVAEDVWIDYPHELADLVQYSDPDDGFILDKSPAVHALLRNPLDGVEDESGGPPYRYLSAGTVLHDAMRLGVRIAQQGYLPDYLLALWPGGVIAGLGIHEVFKYFHKKEGRTEPRPDHVPLNTTSTHLSYKTNILGLDYLLERVEHHHEILLVDTAFRSGRITSDVVHVLKEALRRNLDLDKIKIASVYWNPGDESTWTVRPFKLEPDFYLKKVDHYVVYPHAVYRLKNPRRELLEQNPELREVLFG